MKMSYPKLQWVSINGNDLSIYDDELSINESSGNILGWSLNIHIPFNSNKLSRYVYLLGL